MIKVSRLTMIVTAIFTVSVPAHAGYVNKSADLTKMSPASKNAYAIGVMDGSQAGWLLANKTDQNSIEAVNNGRMQCLIDNALTPELLPKLIDDTYTGSPEAWPLPPSAILNNALAKMCKPEINAERVKRGLPAFK